MKYLLLLLLALALAAVAAAWVRYGGGEPYPDLTSAPEPPDEALQEAVLRPRAHVEANSPCRIFRFRPGADGIPGRRTADIDGFRGIPLDDSRRDRHATDLRRQLADPQPSQNN